MQNEVKLKVGRRIRWNTGRTYTDKGQRIAAQSVGDCVVMVDVDRGIEYLLTGCELSESSIMVRYDSHQGCEYVPAAYRAIETSLVKWARKMS